MIHINVSCCKVSPRDAELKNLEMRQTLFINQIPSRGTNSADAAALSLHADLFYTTTDERHRGKSRTKL